MNLMNINRKVPSKYNMTNILVFHKLFHDLLAAKFEKRGKN